MEERRTGVVRKRIFEILDAGGKDEFFKIPDLTLAETLHARIGGPEFVSFANMFRELDFLIGSKQVTEPVRKIVEKIYWNSHHLDREEYFNRRKVH